MDRDDLTDATRRAVLKATAGTLGVAATGSASAHEWGTDEEGPAGENTWTSQERNRGVTHGADVVGYHALGGVGPSNANYRAEAQDPHYGGITEIRTHGDYAYVTIFSSDSPTPGRGMAILDISDYNAADGPEDLDTAALTVLSFLRNNNGAAAVMDVKVSDDGEYVFLSTQPYTALFGTASGNTDDPSHSEVADPTPNTGDHSFTAVPGGLVAVDVSDPGNPSAVNTFQLSGTGSHNAFHHRIDGDDYLFAVHDLNDYSEGMYVVRFDRSSGRFELVNRWRFENNLAQGQASVESAYIHDVESQDDPRTGTPVAYLSYWDRGVWALDISDPSNIEALGHFDMAAAHFTSPAPTLVNGKRVAVASQEVSESDTHTGRIYLVDADGLFESDPTYDSVPRTDAGIAQLGELAMWEWQNEYQYDVENAVEFGPYDFALSPHNSDFARHVDPATGEVTFWIHQAHYGGGVRFLKVTPGDKDGLVGDDRFKQVDSDPDGDGLTGADGPHVATDWRLSEEGFSRPTYGTPKSSRMEGLNYITPFVWGAVESNGVTFASDINQGVHAIHQHDIPIGGADPVAGVTRSGDASVFTAGQTEQITIGLDFSDREVLVRDRLADGWNVVGGDGTATDDGHVEFDLGVGEERSYFVEAPSDTGSYTFGPVEVSADDGTTWHALADTTMTNWVVGQSTAVGTAVLASGAVASQRDRLVERVRDHFGRAE